MIRFYSTTHFLDRIEILRKVRKGVYSSVEEEIALAFRNVPIEQVRNNRDMILYDESRIIIKLRIPDRKHRLSKSNGYRLIYLVYKDREEVAFLDVYPKNGPLQQLSISEDELVSLLTQYVEEKETGTLSLYTL